jgi:hypothetical protein
LLECGVPKNDPSIRKVAAFIRGYPKAGVKPGPRTYDVSLALLFLDHLDDAQDKGLVGKLALCLVAGQTASGGWNYFCPLLSDADNRVLASLLQKSQGQRTVNVATAKLELKAVDPSKLRLDGNPAVPAAVARLPVWRADTVAGQVDSDNSNTQFAILALWAAKARGMPVERALALAVARFHKSQNADGSWGYRVAGQYKTLNGWGRGPAPTTCAGLLGLAVGQGLVNEARGPGSPVRQHAARQDPAIQRGLDYVARQIADPHPRWQNASAAPITDLYFLWSLERVGVIFSLPKIGGKDWYGWGAEKLVANQTIQGDRGYWPDGRRYPGENPLVNSCFALLFLKQANLAKDLTSKLALAE